MLHTFSFFFIAVILSLFSIQVLHGAGPAHIHLKENAYVQPGKVFLKDISSLKNTDNEWIEKIRNIPIADEPVFGAVKTLSRHQIDTIIRKADNSIHGIQFSGAAIVRIRLQGRKTSREEIVPVLKTYLMETTQWMDQEIVIGSIKNIDKIELPPGEIILGISSKSPIVGKGKMLVPVDATRNGKILSSFWVTAEVHIKSAILTAGIRIPYKKVITEEDIAKVVTEINDPHAQIYRNNEDILGKISKRNISPGDPLTRGAFTEPFHVNSGEKIMLRLERNGIELTTLVRAEQNGRLGQIIRVRNLEYSSTIEAMVTGRSKVAIH